MKHLKIIGLVAVAAAAFMAFVGAGSASADVLCTTSGNPCANKITTIVLSLASSQSGLVRDTSGNEFATCTSTTLDASVTAQGLGVNPSGPITTLTQTCSVTIDTVVNGSLELRTEAGVAAVWAKESQVTLVAFGVTCTYGAGAGTKIGTLNTGAGATVTVNSVINKTAGSLLCPATVRYFGSYTVTNHSQLFVTQE